MAKNSQSQSKPEAEPLKAVERDPLIITRSELNALSEQDKQAFRDLGGTVTEDPQ